MRLKAKTSFKSYERFLKNCWSKYAKSSAILNYYELSPQCQCTFVSRSTLRSPHVLISAELSAKRYRSYILCEKRKYLQMNLLHWQQTFQDLNTHLRLYPRELYGDLHHQVEQFGTFQVLKWAETQTSALSFSSTMVVMTTFPPPTEGLHHVQDKTEAFIHDKSCGVGTLYIAAE